MKTLIFIFAFVLSAFPYKYMDIIIDHDRVTETASSFLYQFDLSDSIDVIEDEITDESNIIVCVPGDTATKYPRYIHYIAGKRLLLYVSASKSSTVDRTLRVCFGSEFAAMNATATFTNNNVTNFWGVDRFSGNTFYDYAGSNNGTGTSVDTIIGQFGVGMNYNSVNDVTAFGSIGALSSKQKFTVEHTASMSSLATNLTHYIIYVNSTTSFYMQTNATHLFVIMGTATASIPFSGNITAGKLHHYNVAYNGTLTGNDNRLIFYIDGVKKTLTFTGTWPSSSPNFGAAGMSMGYAGASNVGKFDEFVITSDAKSDGYTTDRYRMLFDTTFYSVGAMRFPGTFRLDSVGISQFIAWGTFPTIDSAYVNLSKATINGANGDSLLITAASPLMWRRETYPITLYSGIVPYTFPYYFLERDDAISSQLSIGISVGF